jgi:hypothetical protein
MQFTVAVLLIILFPIIVDIIIILDIFKNDKLNNSKKLLWICLVCLFPIWGAIIYFFTQKKKL